LLFEISRNQAVAATPLLVLSPQALARAAKSSASLLCQARACSVIEITVTVY